MKNLQGKIISLKNPKTARVEVTRMWTHHLYGKRVKRSKNYASGFDPEKMKLAIGDVVEIQECRPLSKTKKFKVIKKIEK